MLDELPDLLLHIPIVLLIDGDLRLQVTDLILEDAKGVMILRRCRRLIPDHECLLSVFNFTLKRLVDLQLLHFLYLEVADLLLEVVF